MEEIVNRVANSPLMIFDLEDYYPSGIRTQLDLAQWLFEGFILKEKDFREALKNHDWSVIRVIMLLCILVPMLFYQLGPLYW